MRKMRANAVPTERYSCASTPSATSNENKRKIHGAAATAIAVSATAKAFSLSNLNE